MTSAKPRIRVKAGRNVVASQNPIPSIAGTGQEISRPDYGSKWMRDNRSGVIASRPAYLRESRDEIRQVWERSAALATDLIQNSGKLRGASDQVITDTVGKGLSLNPTPDLTKLGYDEKETALFVADVKREFRQWSQNPAECDLRGKLTLAQQVDVGLRWHMSYGEICGMISYMSRSDRRRYGIKSGTKICLIPPSRMVQDTNEYERIFQGVVSDQNGRATAYRLNDRKSGVTQKVDYPARDNKGRDLFMHVFDPFDATDMRGISILAAAYRKHLQHDILVDATLQTAILQTIFAATLTSPEMSSEAFEAISALDEGGDDGKALAKDFLGFFGAALDRAKESSINVSGTPQISHLGPGEEFKLHAATTPTDNFFPLADNLDREVARAIGISNSGYTMNYKGATYSSVRMENATIWPVVERRRTRIAGRQSQMAYIAWLDEMIGTGRIPFKGGYQAFFANREKVFPAIWQGPPKPTADDKKSAQAATERLQNGTSAIAIEAAELGIDADELFEMRKRENAQYVAEGMPSPFERRGGGAPPEKPENDDDAPGQEAA